MSRALLLVYIASFGSLASFNLMLGITPLYALDAGESDLNAALTSTVFMLATVAGELGTNTVMRRIGQQRTLALGIALMCLPVFVLLASNALPVILGVSVVRGVGFALVLIAGASMVGALSDSTRHGRSLAIYGVVVGIPAIVALPFGVWLVDQVGFVPLFIGAGLVAVLAVPVLLARLELPAPDELHGLLRTLRHPGVLRYAVIFASATFAYGVLITWAPIVGGAVHDSGSAALALFAFGASSTAARWVAGQIGDRRSPTILLAPALVIAASGLMVTALVPSLMILGALVFGVGLGFLQNSTLQLMFAVAGPSGYGSASAIWNIAYDVGLAAGALAFGLMASSYWLSLVVCAAVVIAAIALVRRSGSSASSQVTAG